MKGQAYFVVDAQFFVDFCKGSGPRYLTCVEHGFPSDATIVRMGHDYMGRLNIVLESDSFAPREEFGPIPRLPDPLFNKLYPVSNPPEGWTT